MVGPYGYCADISRAFVEGHKFNEEQKKLYQMAVEHINHNSRLIKPGMSFKEFTEKSWKLPDEYYGNRYSCMVHGIGLCDEWPMIRYPTDGGKREGSFEKNMAAVLYEGKWGLLNEQGFEVVPTLYDAVKVGETGDVWVKESGAWRLYDLKKIEFQDLI